MVIEVRMRFCTPYLIIVGGPLLKPPLHNEKKVGF